MDIDTLFKELSRLNDWQGRGLESGVLREGCLSKLREFSGNRLVKVLMGQRRSGKSYLLRQWVRELQKNGVCPRNIFYFDKERLPFMEVSDHASLDLLIREYRSRCSVSGKVYLLLDEIQEVNGWERLVVSYARDEIEEYEVYVTGSNSRMLSTELGTSLSGRHVALEVFPFSFVEYARSRGLDSDKAALLEYLRAGGLPELSTLRTEEARRHYVMALLDSVLLNDIVRKFHVQDVDLMQRLFLFICSSVGSLFSVNKIVRHLNSAGGRANVETLSRYLEHLERALLIHACPRYDIRGKELLSGARKYYLNDLAFREHFSSGFDPGLSRRLENALFLHLKSHGYKVRVGSSRGLEVDFVLEKGAAKAYVQCCYLLSDEAVVEREFRGLMSIRDHYPKMVVTLDDTSFGNRGGIRHLLAWEFLQADPLG